MEHCSLRKENKDGLKELLSTRPLEDLALRGCTGLDTCYTPNEFWDYFVHKLGGKFPTLRLRASKTEQDWEKTDFFVRRLAELAFFDLRFPLWQLRLEGLCPNMALVRHCILVWYHLLPEPASSKPFIIKFLLPPSVALTTKYFRDFLVHNVRLPFEDAAIIDWKFHPTGRPRHVFSEDRCRFIVTRPKDNSRFIIYCARKVQ